MKLRSFLDKTFCSKKRGKKLDFLIEHKYTIVILLISLGIFLRFFIMTFGHNYDFESYKVAGEISGNFHNVYANTERYNYGPVFFCLQGLLYNISHISPDWETTYRVLIVLVLTLFDLGITLFIAKKYSVKKALIFFLNPISIFITGYHNQFDNIAIFFALMSIWYFNEDKKYSKKDILFILFMSLSIVTKHIFAIFMLFIILKKGLPLKKRLVYAFVPSILFLLSFLPFIFSSGALEGIVHNVFLYNSANNSPLLIGVLQAVNVPKSLYTIIFLSLMTVTAFMCRKKKYDESILIYTIALVAFSSAIANQYLVIPLAALCILETGFLKYIYMALCSIFLFINIDGLNMLDAIKAKSHLLGGTVSLISYSLLAWVLLIILLVVMMLKRPITRKSVRIKKEER